ncbi:hypothetical protein XM38_041280 [Halomicronema hongdechloris C2206]|uniref:EcxA zinc-binding domain-containing protein n=1 Tax=Halomicronema hongdechloris C2206 TaxID=1641165 RepID=A0A1Z3HSB8_9CYAN|nr:zinc-dependent metalloprotease [Halomicronema hongdechloris]ASC73166.1 hypothetical protein XM38_041280 [Halomicronema hongdechloris C2206]
MATSLLSDPLADDDALDTYIYQYLRALTAHEVGHVLGLRHNFLGSTLLAPEELNDRAATRQRGLVSSVMDYFPPNLAPPDSEQGDYFPVTVGLYDQWAIEYGYRPFPQALPHQAQQQLQQIAQRSPAPELAYAADEDIWNFIDPMANAWDLQQ